jgi:HAMP domain-containing protein
MLRVRQTRTHDEVTRELSNKKMKRLIPLLVGGLLVLSLALNIFLWNRLSSQSNELKSAQDSASEMDELRRQNQELQMNRTSATDSASANAGELARLRNEIGQLRKHAGEAAELQAQAAEAAQLRAQLAVATQNLARAESALADAVKLSPEELQQMKDEAQSTQCISNLKQIGLAARM